MAEMSNEKFPSCIAAVQALLSRTLPCLQNAIDLWHHEITQNQQPCSTPNQCPQRMKPSKNKHCRACIDWAKAIETEVFPPSGSLQWSNANPTLFSKDPLEVIKLFAVRIPGNRTYSTLEDFDSASLLMIMSKFKGFHHGDHIFADKVQKVAEVRNYLAHLKLGDNMLLDDQTFNAFWSDITDLVDGVQGLGRPYFNQQTAQELHKQLSEIKVQPTLSHEVCRRIGEKLKSLGDTFENDVKISEDIANLEESESLASWQPLTDFSEPPESAMNTQYKYDFFVVYDQGCEKASNFVEYHLLPQLEQGRHRLKGCIQERDFMPGRSRIENLTSAVTRSATILFIITANIFEGDLCNLALHVSLEKRKKMIPILLDSVTLPPMLQHLQDIDAAKEIDWDVLKKRLIPKMATTPAEILARGPTAVAAYKEAIKSGKKAVYRTRLVFVGQERVGKTSLKRRLIGESYWDETRTDGRYSQAGTSHAIHICPSIKKGVGVYREVGSYKDEYGSLYFCLDVTNVLYISVWDYTRFDANEPITESIDASSVCRIDIQHAKDWKVVSTHGETYYQALAGEITKKLKLEEDKQETKSDERMQDLPEGETQPIQPAGAILGSTAGKVVGAVARKVVGATAAIVARILRRQDHEAESTENEYPEEVAEDVAKQLLQSDELKLDEAKEIIFSLWDFAGQDLYYTTHQVFLSKRAVFVLVFNLMEGKDHANDKTFLDKLDFWMKSIYSLLLTDDKQTEEDTYCPQNQRSPPIFIVGTHRDDLQGDATLQNDIFKAVDNLLEDKRYQEHVVTETFAVENALDDDEQVTKLRERITHVAEQEDYMKEENTEIPLRWIQFEDEVKKKVSERVYSMSIEQVRELKGARDIPDTAPDELRTMLQFYHDLGVIIYFPDARPPLCDCVILNPLWLIDVFKSIITVLDKKGRRAQDKRAWKRLENEGVLEDSLITHMWRKFLKSEDADTNKCQKEALLTLMERYYLLVPKNSCNEMNTCYYVPARIQTDSLKVCDLTNIPDDHTIFFIDFDDFLTDAIFFQLLARAVSWSQKQVDVSDELNIQKGIFLADSNHEFQLQRNGNVIKVSIKRADIVGNARSSPAIVNGETSNKVKAFLEDSLKDLKQTWLPGIKYQFCVACPCGMDDQHYLNLDTCLTGIHENISCKKGKLISKRRIGEKFATQCPGSLFPEYPSPTVVYESPTLVSGNQTVLHGNQTVVHGNATFNVTQIGNDQQNSALPSYDGNLPNMDDGRSELLGACASGINQQGTSSKSTEDIVPSDTPRTVISVNAEYDKKCKGLNEATNTILALYNGKHGGDVQLVNCTELKPGQKIKEDFDKKLMDYRLKEKYELTLEKDYSIEGKIHFDKYRTVTVHPTSKLPLHSCTHAVEKVRKSVLPITRTEILCSIANNKENPELPTPLNPSEFYEGKCFGDETEQQEFKLYSNTENLVKNIFDDVPRYVSAFANTRGGHIYIGIDDDGTVYGQELRWIGDALGFQTFLRRLEGKLKTMIWLQDGKNLTKDKAIHMTRHWDLEFIELVDPPPTTAPLLGKEVSDLEGKQTAKGKGAHKKEHLSVVAQSSTANVQQGEVSNEKSQNVEDTKSGSVLTASVGSKHLPGTASPSELTEEVKSHTGGAATRSQEGKDRQGGNEVVSNKSSTMRKDLPTYRHPEGNDKKVVIMITIPRLVGGIVFKRKPDCPVYRDGMVRMMTEEEWAKKWMPLLFP